MLVLGSGALAGCAGPAVSTSSSVAGVMRSTPPERTSSAPAATTTSTPSDPCASTLFHTIDDGFPPPDAPAFDLAALGRHPLVYVSVKSYNRDAAGANPALPYVEIRYGVLCPRQNVVLQVVVDSNQRVVIDSEAYARNLTDDWAILGHTSMLV